MQYQLNKRINEIMLRASHLYHRHYHQHPFYDDSDSDD